MHSSMFFNLFPPPSYLMIKYAGLDISDDAIRCIQYKKTAKGTEISSFASLALAPGLVDGGDMKTPEEMQKIVSKFAHANRISYAKVSLPEEKAYLFVTEVPDTDEHSIRQNIEFKLEENVPVSARDALFSFDILRTAGSAGNLQASVSVVPKSYVEYQSAFLEKAGITPVDFEPVPKSIARSIIAGDDAKTRIIANIMDRKTGIYVAVGNVVCFTSTIPWGSRMRSGDAPGDVDSGPLSKELNRVCAFWASRSSADSAIREMILVGHDASSYEEMLQNAVSGKPLPVKTAQTWQNILDTGRYMPPISYADSLEYAAAAGLAVSI